MYHIYVPRGLELFIHHNVFFSTFACYIHVSLILSRFRRSFKIKSFISCDSDVNRIPRVIPSYIYRCYVHVLLFLYCYLRKFFFHTYMRENWYIMICYWYVNIMIRVHGFAHVCIFFLLTCTKCVHVIARTVTYMYACNI